MIKKIIFILLLFLLAAVLFASPVSAGGQHNGSDGWKTLSSSSLQTYEYQLTGGKYYLTEDIALNRTLVIPVSPVELDLNGYSLILNADTDHVISINNNAVLTLSDCKGTGKITGLRNSCGDRIGDYGGGVYVIYGTFIMDGGTICECTAHCGGGVYVSPESRFVMNGGCIDSCYATIGAGIYNEGEVTLNGGVISNSGKSLKYEATLREYCTHQGGAVYNYKDLIVNDCTIVNCHSKLGGAIFNARHEYSEIQPVLIINGGLFKDNFSDFHTGGDDLYSTAPVICAGGCLEDSVFISLTEIEISGPAFLLGDITLSGSTVFVDGSWRGYARPDYSFDGWYVKDYDRYYKFKEQKRGQWQYYAYNDITLRARWLPDEYTVPATKPLPKVEIPHTPVPEVTKQPAAIKTPKPAVTGTAVPAETKTPKPVSSPARTPVQTSSPTQSPASPLPLAGILAGCAAALLVSRRG